MTYTEYTEVKQIITDLQRMKDRKVSVTKLREAMEEITEKGNDIVYVKLSEQYISKPTAEFCANAFLDFIMDELDRCDKTIAELEKKFADFQTE